MPTISSRPQLTGDGSESQFTTDDIVDMITDGVMYVSPHTTPELRKALQVVCRTLWNTNVIEDFYIYDVPTGGCEVGFKVEDDPHYYVIKIN